VRIEAARAMGRLRSPASCKVLITLSGDANLHVALAAIDALASCGPEVAALAEIVARMPATRAPDGAAAQDVAWHAPAHALVALARLAPEAALDYVPRFAGHPAWQARMYAARALGALAPADDNLSVAPPPESRAGKASALLESLAADRHPNVREAAVGALSQVRGHAADSIYIETLGAADYQLVMTAARALRQSPGRDRAVPALIASLDRISAERRETSRDPRRALLERLKELGSAEHARALEPYLNDSDPAIAALAAEVLSAWTGTAQAARTTRAPASGAPVAAEAEALAGSAAVVTMIGGGSFMLRLLPEEAPVSVLRFVRLARAGYYNGLTFHRVVPNFVIQGGSPGANEYMGDGPYLRDEVGLRSHARGTVGISTRGRDTGDAQIFVNLVDNPRLDHDYTVCAEIIDGMDVVDAIAEGAVIARITIVSTPQVRGRSSESWEERARRLPRRAPVRPTSPHGSMAASPKVTVASAE